MWTQKKKWGIAVSQTVLNQKFDSKFEAGEALELEAKKRSGEIKEWKAHQQIELIVNGYRICNYYIDFVVTHNDDSTEYIETKGLPTAAWAIKWKLFEALYSEKPDVKLTVIFQGKNRRPKAKKLKYGIKL